MIFPISFTSGLFGLTDGTQCPPGYSYGIACQADYCTVMECITPGCCTCRKRTEDPLCVSPTPISVEPPQIPTCDGLGYFQPCSQLTSCPEGYYIWRQGDCCTCAVSPKSPGVKVHLGPGEVPKPQPQNPCADGHPCETLVCPAAAPHKWDLGNGCCQCKVVPPTGAGEATPAPAGGSTAALQDPLLRIADMITSIGGGGGVPSTPQQQGLVTVPVQQQQRNTLALVLVLAAVAGVGYWYVRRYR